MENVRSPQKKERKSDRSLFCYDCSFLSFFGDWAKHWIFWQYPYAPCMIMYAIFTYIWAISRAAVDTYSILFNTFRADV